MTTAIILAGGFGTRLQSAVSDVPKPMAPIKGRPFLEYQLDYWIAQGITRFIISVGYKHEIIRDFFGDKYKDVQLEYVIEQIPLGTGGGLLLATGKLEDNSSFLLLNGDTYFAVDLKKLMQFAQENKADWCLSLFSINNQNNRYMGVEVSPDGCIHTLRSENKKKHALINGGVYWIQKRALPTSPVFYDNISLESTLLPNALIAGQRIFALEFSGKFIDIGLPEDYCRSASFLV